jgi:hypothetical protein
MPDDVYAAARESLGAAHISRVIPSECEGPHIGSTGPNKVLRESRESALHFTPDLIREVPRYARNDNNAQRRDLFFTFARQFRFDFA